ncbi:MAG: hypothetical protein V1898_03805, partial [Patescibacteria group bacterium]
IYFKIMSEARFIRPPFGKPQPVWREGDRDEVDSEDRVSQSNESMADLLLSRDATESGKRELIREYLLQLATAIDAVNSLSLRREEILARNAELAKQVGIRVDRILRRLVGKDRQVEPELSRLPSALPEVVKPKFAEKKWGYRKIYREVKAELARRGRSLNIPFADIKAQLDAMKSEWEESDTWSRNDATLVRKSVAEVAISTIVDEYMKIRLESENHNMLTDRQIVHTLRSLGYVFTSTDLHASLAVSHSHGLSFAETVLNDSGRRVVHFAPALIDFIINEGLAVKKPKSIEFPSEESTRNLRTEAKLEKWPIVYFTDENIINDLQAFVDKLNETSEKVITIADLSTDNFLNCRAVCANKEEVRGAVYIENFLMAAGIVKNSREAKKIQGPTLNELKKRAGVEIIEYAMMNSDYFSVTNINSDLLAFVAKLNETSEKVITISDLSTTNLSKCKAVCTNGEEVNGVVYIRRFLTAKGFAKNSNEARTMQGFGLEGLKNRIQI